MLSESRGKPRSTPRNAGGHRSSKRRPPAQGRRTRAASLLRPAFKRAIWSTYDHIGLLVLANLLWVVLCLPVVTAPAATAGLFHLARQIARGRDASLGEFFVGFRSHFFPAFKLGLVDLAALLVLWVNIDFYSHLRGAATIPGMVLAAAMIWVTGFFVLMHAHLYALLAGGESSLRQLLRKSALLTLDNLAFTIGITVQALSLSTLCVITGAGLVLIDGSAVAVLLTTGHRELLRKYSDDPKKSPELPETRTLRDLWRPWESGKDDE
ncbi:MAG: DUF624 domain-containing protein [Candidatus Eisenbacteria sp.]|nr:DUF624 domain-containing protein [Candidatus Eisenbacteria bacterium]